MWDILEIVLKLLTSSPTSFTSYRGRRIIESSMASNNGVSLATRAVALPLLNTLFALLAPHSGRSPPRALLQHPRASLSWGVEEPCVPTSTPAIPTQQTSR